MNPPRILHIEDSESDAHFFDYAIKAIETPVTVERVASWSKLEEYLKKLINQPTEDYPGLIIMDHDVDGTDAVSVINHLRKNDLLKLIPIVVFSGYDYLQAINEYYRAGASSYILKPLTIDEMIVIVQQMVHYWFSVNKGPGD